MTTQLVSGPPVKAALWAIKSDDGTGYWTDDTGGWLFVSVREAARVVARHCLSGVTIVDCGLDDDLAQMTKLYCERLARVEHEDQICRVCGRMFTHIIGSLDSIDSRGICLSCASKGGVA